MRAALAAAALVAAVGCGHEGDPAPGDGAAAAPFEWPSGPRPTATLHVVGLGEITIELYPELAPRTVESFLSLAEQGFYDGTTFHRVVPGFMIQGGDPNSRDRDPRNDGQGGPGYTLPDETNAAPHERGAVSLANEGRPDTGGSQFFIVQQPARHLDGRHSVFGRVIRGLELVDRISEVEVDAYGRWGARERPIESVVVERVTVESATRTAAVAPGDA